MDRAPLSFRAIEAVDAVLRRHAPPGVKRAAYRVGYLVLVPWWFVTRPHSTGSKAVVCRGDDVLMVRHSYARRGMWDLPGGFVRAGEDPEVAVRRELAEELGITPRRIREIGALRMHSDFKREVVHVYAADVQTGDVRPDPAEIAEVRWIARDALPAATTPFVRRLVARAYWEVWDWEE